MKLSVWDEKQATATLNQRLKDARNDRRAKESNWKDSERVVFDTHGDMDNGGASSSLENNSIGLSGIDQQEGYVNINYVFKNYRFIHAQLSANPPTVVPRAASPDLKDIRKTEAADILIKYALRKYQLQEVVDKATANTLLYGTGFTKTIWDTTKGEPIDFDEETGEYILEGEFNVTVPNVWDIFVDPDATSWDTVNWIFEKISISWEEAKYRFPDKINILKQYRKTNGDTSSYEGGDGTRDSSLPRNQYDVVEIYEYWEKGSPMNGFLGRYCLCTADGHQLSPMGENPEKIKSSKSNIEVARLPYQILTDIDVPNFVWGKSFIDYNIAIQDNLTRIDNLALDNLRAHGVARLIIPEGSEISDDSITESPWDIIKVSGNAHDIHFAPPMQLPNVVTDLMGRYKVGIDEMSGVNESMFGQQSRETSGASMQYATNQGNMVRRRLFNKYVLFVEAIYRSYLSIVQRNWTIPQTVRVYGEERAPLTRDIKGADIDGGFDLIVEYGTNLSLDPTTRREELITLMPFLEKAGMDSQTMLGLLKLNDITGAFDIVGMAKRRQKEIFDKMIKSGIYIAPKELENHKDMLPFGYQYVMTAEFNNLDKDDQVLIEQHIRDREKLLPQPDPAAAVPPPGAPPVPGGIV